MPSQRLLARRPLRATLVAIAAVGLLAAALAVPGGAQANNPVAAPAAAPADGEGSEFLGDSASLGDKDFRTGSVNPTAAQQAAVRNLDASVRWNRFGTPATLVKHGGYLATGLNGSAADAARGWLRSNAALFRLTTTDVNRLELVGDSPLADSPGRAVMFQQQFGSLSSTQDGLITVGMSRGKIGYVSSSAAGHRAAPATATLTARQAWLRAATHVGRDVSLGDIGDVRQDGGWTVFPVDGFGTPFVDAGKPATRMDQRARLVALPTYAGGVRPAFEVNVVDDRAGEPVIGYVVFVDARTGAVLLRRNAVDGLAAGLPAAPQSGTFTGDYLATPPDECGPEHDIPVDADNRSLGVTAYPTPVVANDIQLIVRDPGGTNRGTSDITGTGVPEVVVVDIPAPGEPGTWTAQVCESANPVADSVPPGTYVGTFSAVDQSQEEAELFSLPEWNFFTANPALPNGAISPPYNFPNTDNRTHACWSSQDSGASPECQIDLTPNTGDSNLASRVPWDHIVQTNTPSFQTVGNNAITAEGWNAALTPGPTSQRPIDFDRTYGFLELADPRSVTGALEGWTNAWNENRCDYLVAQTPAQNNLDVMAATTTLHVGHNRFHDFSYHLGFTERNFNLQVNNFGNTPPGPFPLAQEDDPEIGDIQNGATLPAAIGLTRDNANQITLQDGVPGITNQYLFQPIAGAFYAPCADGDLDASVYGHEYTHAISNRMVAGPNSGLSGAQAGAMGESWSDQVAVEYLNAFNFVPTSGGENPFAVGIYATGNKDRAIRNYGMNRSPLNYSDIGYDMVCTRSLVGPPVEPDCEDDEGQVHADGEIWSATGHDIRTALVNKYNGAFPAGNNALQQRCAEGNLPADKCPGNRRWIQIMFDAFLLQQSDTDFLAARDAYLAADQLRFGGSEPGPTNQRELWASFAGRGMGSCSLNPSASCHDTRSASTNGTEDDNPQPSFESPLVGEKRVTFIARNTQTGERIDAKFFVGRYAARATPLADTDSGTPLAGNARFVRGTYSIIAQAEGFGQRRFQLVSNGTGSSTVSFGMMPNLASETNGATAAGDGANHQDLIDDDEATTWDVADTGDNVDVAEPTVTVDLAGEGSQEVRSVRVSALLTPSPPESRFTALRQFEIQACNAAAPVNADCSDAANFDSILTSSEDAFDAVAPRPVAPDLTLRSFDVIDTIATHIRLVALDNQCTGAPDYQGMQSNDLAAPTDCSENSTRSDELHVAELQVLASGVDGSDPPPGGPKDPVVALVKDGPLTAAAGSNLLYTISATNLGPETSSSARLFDTLPAGTAFVQASGGGQFNAATGRVTWRLGDVPVDATRSRTLVVRVPTGTDVGTLLLNQAEFIAPLTVSTPAAALTAVQ